MPSLASLIAKLLGLLATAALAAPIMPMSHGMGMGSDTSEVEKVAYGLRSPAHFKPSFGRPVIEDYQGEIDAVNAEQTLGKVHRKGSKGAYL